MGDLTPTPSLKGRGSEGGVARRGRPGENWREARAGVAGLKVLDVTNHVAGPFCTLLLGGYGAKVTKIERPGSGDCARSAGPFLHDEPHPEKSGLFLHLNRNKKSVTLNLKHAEGKALFTHLAKEADVLVENFRPRVMERLGFDYDALCAINPGIIVCSISNFGQSGPYRDWKATDMVLYGMGGPMLSSGLPEREPVRMADNLVLYHAGLVAAAAVLSAVYVREMRGFGQHLDISIFETAASSANWRLMNLVSYAYSGRSAERTKSVYLGYPTGYFECKDGYVAIVAGNEHFPRACALIGKPELAHDPRFSTREAQLDPRAREEFMNSYFLPWVRERTKAEFLEAGLRARPLCGVINTTADVMRFSQWRDRGYFESIDHPLAGPLPYTGAPFRMGRVPWHAERAPLLGEHTGEVLARLGFSKADMVRLRETGAV